MAKIMVNNTSTTAIFFKTNCVNSCSLFTKNIFIFTKVNHIYRLRICFYLKYDYPW